MQQERTLRLSVVVSIVEFGVYGLKFGVGCPLLGVGLRDLGL